jgi:hypothetical protein
LLVHTCSGTTAAAALGNATMDAVGNHCWEYGGLLPGFMAYQASVEEQNSSW